MTKCAILGAGGHGKVVADIAQKNGYKHIVFFDDRWPSLRDIEHWSIEGDTEALKLSVSDFDAVFIGIGNNKLRLSKFYELDSHGANLPSLIDPSAVVSCYAKVGQGTLVSAKSVINAFAVIGKSCIINTGAIIEHDCSIADGVHVCPGALLAGAVNVNQRAWIGIGAQVIQLKQIGADAIVGAGATVTKDVLENVTVIGTPAQVINS
ncbi:acetyltransferase [Enterovibrio paralichthyis]|uniref:acetyltransferase n=1 Tax=Enterovibrio paralichthyis TaxID=2853805 RepID=UPI001C485D88|nr:acetyltransferase [Enterovibrio paralichthyis]MBV7298643.1 acetyltransferase [Enterovibrio paralichthyis]